MPSKTLNAILKPPRIAIVDDQESVLKAVERLLRSAGMETEVFSSGEKFVNAMSTLSVDCVVLDLHMPSMSGFDVQACLMQFGKRLPIIVVTGRDNLNSRARAFAGGAAAYLLKPIDDRVLLDAIAMATANT